MNKKEEAVLGVLESVQNDIHGYMLGILARLERTAPSEAAEHKAWTKNPAAFHKTRREAVETSQRIVANGYGTTTTNNLNITVIKKLGTLCLKDQQKLLTEALAEHIKKGENFGYIGKTEVIDAEVIPEATGVNRMANDDKVD